MNILQQLKAAKRLKNVHEAVGKMMTEGIRSRRVYGKRRKEYRYWCPNCQQWVLCRAGFACAECYHYLPEKQAEWELKKKQTY